MITNKINWLILVIIKSFNWFYWWSLNQSTRWMNECLTFALKCRSEILLTFPNGQIPEFFRSIPCQPNFSDRWNPIFFFTDRYKIFSTKFFLQSDSLISQKLFITLISSGIIAIAMKKRWKTFSNTFVTNWRILWKKTENKLNLINY